MKNPRSFFVTYNLRLLTLFLAGFLILSSNQTAHAGDENALSVTVSEGQLVPVTDVPEVRKKRELLGWFAYGLNNSGPTEAAHWQEMCQNKDCDVCHWQELKSV